MSLQTQTESSPIGMYRDDQSDNEDIDKRINCTCDAANIDCTGCEGCEGCDSCEACYDNKKNNLIYEKLIQLIAEKMDKDPGSNPTQIHFLVSTWLKQHGIIDLPFEFKRFLDGLFHGKSGSLDIDAYGRHEVDSIINIQDTNMRILSVGIFTFEARDVNYLELHAFISKNMESNPQTDPESMEEHAYY